MKIVVLLIAGFFAVNMVVGQKGLEFKETKHAFGKVQQHKPVTHAFTFTNTSGKPVVIETANADCGCTTPEYPKGVIAKSGTGTIKVTYNAEAMGVFTKNVTVKLANVAEPIILTINGDVVTTAAKPVKKKMG